MASAQRASSSSTESPRSQAPLACAQSRLHMLETPHELVRGSSQGRFGVEFVPAREVHGRKEQVADLVGHGVGSSGRRFLDLADLLADLGQNLARPFASRSPPWRPSPALSARASTPAAWQANRPCCDGTPSPPRPAFSFSRRLISSQRTSTAAVSVEPVIAENVRMAADHLFADLARHGVEIERPALRRDLRSAKPRAAGGRRVPRAGWDRHRPRWRPEPRRFPPGAPCAGWRGFVPDPTGNRRARGAARRWRADCSSGDAVHPKISRPALCAGARRGRVRGSRARCASDSPSRVC